MRKLTKITVAVLLGLMFILIYTSALNDSATMDELAHIPAAYSYLSQRDYRLNPEHPPLIKDMAAMPLMFLNLNFPTDIVEWTNADGKHINGQWDMGRIFLYESGNNADQIIHWARLPIMLLAILFGWMFFRWVRNLYGDKVALLALFFFVFSPTFLAHSRYVTTDLAAAFGFFIGIAAFLNFLKKSSSAGSASSLQANSERVNSRQARKSLIIAGIAFGIAQLLKFSLMLLAPIYLVFGALWIFLQYYEKFCWKSFLKAELLMFGKIILIGLIGVAMILPIYMFHVWQYPIERQVHDAKFLLSSFGIRPLVNLTVWLSSIPVLRALGQYMLGLLMVLQRASGGNTTYFMGAISATGWHHYFPLLYLLKEYLAFHLLTLLAVLFSIRNILQNKEKKLKNALEWMRENFVLTAGIIFIAIYWIQAIFSPLNIGIRHVLPTFPFIYLLVARQAIRWIKNDTAEPPHTFMEDVKKIYSMFIRPAQKTIFLSLLITWIFIATFINFPYFLSYYNELGGGTNQGYKFAVDSNYDWGQDLKRLKDWAGKNLTADNRIAIDYFGGGNPEYYFGEKFEPWWSSRGILKPENGDPQWLALSLTFLMGGHATPVKNFSQKPEDTYSWLRDKTPIARAGTSIFIYQF